MAGLHLSDEATTGATVSELIGGAETGGRFALVDMAIARGAELPRHIHRWEDEAMHVLSGEVEFLVGEERTYACAGTTVFVPRGIEHGFAIRSDRARLLSAFLPAGFDGYFRDTVDLGPDDLDRLIATAARYGCEITGPAPRDDPEVRTPRSTQRR